MIIFGVRVKEIIIICLSFLFACAAISCSNQKEVGNAEISKETEESDIYSDINNEMNENEEIKNEQINEDTILEIDDEGATNIDVYNNDFPITYDRAIDTIMKKKEDIHNKYNIDRIGLRVNYIRMFKNSYYYVIAGYDAGHTDIAPIFAHYYVDVYTGELYELLGLTQRDELIPFDISSLTYLSEKNISEYDMQDCKLILNTSFAELFKNFDIDCSNEPSCGLLLPNTVLSYPVISLKTGIALTGYTDKENLYDSPSALFIWGIDGTGMTCPVDGYSFGDVLDAELPNLANGFIKSSEAGEEEPIKQMEIIENDIKVTLYYEQIDSGVDLPYHLTIFRAEPLRRLFHE